MGRSKLMTRSTVGMSSPRDATSVASSVAQTPDLKASSAERRSRCGLPLCSDTAGTSSSRSSSCSSWQVLMVEVKMMHERTRSSSSMPSRCTRYTSFTLAGRNMYSCRSLSAVRSPSYASKRNASFMSSSASTSRLLVIVALNSSVWRPVDGSVSSTSASSDSKLCSSSRSASSSTRKRVRRKAALMSSSRSSSACTRPPDRAAVRRSPWRRDLCPSRT
mmetsp:Transcript_11306/g.29025  ORF Transcript_11306/g.29025 Transcript_11306/m.29025 type:complete len:219 (+) Transcript_11306:428-1084(+)